MGATGPEESDEGREDVILAAARALDSHQARIVYLNLACGNDKALRKRIEDSIQSEAAGKDFFQTREAPAQEPAISSNLPTAEVPISEGPDTVIGRYRLLEKIGEGGFGVVYVAEQKVPIHRRVALKIIKMGMDTRSVVARFEAERQALAMMDHPNIAKVFDGGATVTGRPYFVMELVRGVPITEYCDQNNLQLSQRLNLFIQVCQAIQHAHQKGIIHGDIKPSNILLTLHDGKPVPKVIDFGIAKATQRELTDKTVYTQFQQFLGTPAYMSPEQAEMTGLDIDTRSDIYSLGVLLYELLTGTTPFDAEELLQSGLDAMRRKIREIEPLRPSTRLSGMADAQSTTTAKRRGMELHRLISQLRGDLDWIVITALDKDRTRRYETANGLARDIERYLNNELVTARPPSAVYRFRKMVRRNRLVFFASALVAASLLAGLGASTWMFFQERQARQRAVTAEQIENQLRQQAESNERKANQEAAKSSQVAQFLEDMLSGVGPSVALGRDTTLLREIMEKTTERVGKDLKDQPEVEADIRLTLGDIFHELRELQKAEDMLRESLRLLKKTEGSNNRDVADVLEDLADVLRDENKLSEAEILAREALAIQRTLGNDNPHIIGALNNLALVVWKQGKLAEADKLNREALEICEKFRGTDDEAVARLLNNLALVLEDEAKLSEAEAMHREALALYRKILGDDHPDISLSLDNLGQVLANEGKLDEAEKMFQEALALRRRVLGDEHDYTVGSLGNLVGVLIAESKTDAVQQLFHEMLTPAVEGRPGSMGILRARASFRVRFEHFDEASKDMAQAVVLNPADHYLWAQLAAVQAERGDLTAYRKVREAMLKRFGQTGDPSVAGRVSYACLLLPATGNDLEIASRLADLSVTLGSDSRSEVLSQFEKALAEYRRGHFEDAIIWARKALSDGTLDSPHKAAAYAVLAMALHQTNRTAESQAAWLEGNETVETKFAKLNWHYLQWEFHEPLMARILLRESKMLIDSQRAAEIDPLKQ
jgi:eukaryotic-like serine/threonine-protein kinase